MSFSVNGNDLKINCGFESNYKSDVYSFSVVGNLSNFWLGFFKDVKSPISNDHFAFLNNAAEPRAKIMIEEFLIRVPVIRYDDLFKIKLINEMKHL